MSDGQLSAFPVNSAILVFEQGSPELARVLRADDIVGVLSETIEDLRKVAKYGIESAPQFDFSSLQASGVSSEIIQSVAYEIRAGIFRALSSRNIDMDTL